MSDGLDLPALHATHAGIWLAAPGAAPQGIGRGAALAQVAATPTILLNAPLIAARLGMAEVSGLDLLELFAFVHPARFAVPTPAGLARALGVDPPADEGAAAGLLQQLAARLLDRLRDKDWPEREGAWTAAQALQRARWPWANLVLARMETPARAERWLFSRLPQWEEAPARAEPLPIRLGDAEVRDRLARLVGSGAEPREGQRAYAAQAARAFDPRVAAGRPSVVLAEAGTGIGKTLGYLAPASLWAQQAGAPVWISTYTKALQRQLAAEGSRVFPDPDFVDWLAVDRVEGREYDVGLHRRWLDPTRPLADLVLRPAHGVVVTSATLTGGPVGTGGSWEAAEARSGAIHLDAPIHRFQVASPFDYPNRAEVLIVTDIKRGDLPALAGAYARLIEAAGGGALGLFTAIQRLKAVHARIADRLAREGLPLYAQHVDPIDTGTLVDIFRDDPRASLLGTDALRDGVDVPGESLRLVVLEGVPWPRPTVLHAARRLAGGGAGYDERLVKARLAQGFGRLIRRMDDRGCFVLLSAATPSRLLDAFPPGVKVSRVPLAEAVVRVSEQLSTVTTLGHQARRTAETESDEDADAAQTREIG